MISTLAWLLQMSTYQQDPIPWELPKLQTPGTHPSCILGLQVHHEPFDFPHVFGAWDQTRPLNAFQQLGLQSWLLCELGQVI